MDDLVEILGLRALIDETGLEMGPQRNFEAIYSQLFSDSRYAHTLETIEQLTHEYFSNLSLPDRATIYDRILISLRPTDAVFTFNWDPFLFDAYQRNCGVVPLPEIFFLHGNVRIGVCLDHHDKWGARNLQCPICGRFLADVPLLYPIKKKDYSTNPYICRNWEAARILFSKAFTLTIFGYGAPASDEEAIKMLRLAWFAQSKRTLEHVEIIDNASQPELYARWSPFTPSYHYRIKTTFEQSRIARWPRRSSESLFYPMTQGVPCEDFPLPSTNNVAELQRYAADIAQHETGPDCISPKPS